MAEILKKHGDTAEYNGLKMQVTRVEFIKAGVPTREITINKGSCFYRAEFSKAFCSSVTDDALLQDLAEAFDKVEIKTMF